MLDEKAQELGRLLGQTDEYKALRRATDRLHEDQALQQLLGDVERLAQQIEAAARSGQEPPKEQIEQYDRTLTTVQGNPVYQQVVAAQTNFEKLMAKTNEHIYEGMKKGAASPIIQLS